MQSLTHSVMISVIRLLVNTFLYIKKLEFVDICLLHLLQVWIDQL